ncbi:MAG: bacillithiol biosynthesis cysteine-adding enzyme BshC [Archangium sp.]|nr:bacillithiol biosynthesis cysteine-adding enzyme BshC [Archangium sp.]MDP3569881.1 bacillithiol biosynthesis cysteine-adding enzyme BshC [Archangium sp.]
MSSAFSPAFLRGEARAHAFLPDDFRHASRRAESVRRAATRAVSPSTIAALRAQSARLPAAAAREANLEALATPGTTVVVTGQQVGLFLGPLYSFYKAASAVVTARALQQETGVRCVPVFWLQSEDHDFEEIDHCDVQNGAGELVRLGLDAPGRVLRSSLSSLPLGANVAAALQELAIALEGLPHANEVLESFRRHYRPERTWVSSFAGVMAELFEELVLLDPRDAALAAEIRPVHERAVLECDRIANVLLERTAQLEAAGFAAQVHVRPGAPLSFFHPEGSDGPRFRMEKRDDAFGLVGREDSRSAQQLLACEPLCFSTSALLRPIVQDTLLPTAAIIGGPGELNYFAQLPPLYAHFGLPMPMLVPRARFRVIEPRTRSLLVTLGLTAAEVEAPADQVLKRLRPPAAALTPELLERRLADAIEPLLEAVPAKVGSDVEDAVKRTRKTIERAVSRLSGRYSRELQRGDQTLTDRLERLQRALYPHGEPQERVLGWPGFAARFGLAGFTSLVMAGLEPFSVPVKELSP